MSDTVQMTVHVPKELRTRARGWPPCDGGDTISDVLRAALEEYIQKTGDNEITSEALAAWEE